MTEPKKLALSTRLYYGAGSVAFGVKDNGFSYFLAIYYNLVLGLDGYLVGLAALFYMIFDAISDPIVGHASDRLSSKWGRRHPFMYAAALPVSVSYFFLWNPPTELSQGQLFAYLMVLSIFVRTFVTLYEIPSTSLGPELTKNYDQRTSLMSYRVFFGWWGGLTIGVLNYFVFLKPTEEYAFGQLNPAGYQTYGTVAAIVMFWAIMISSLGTHRHIPELSKPARRPFHLGETFRELKETFSNYNFIVLFIGLLLIAMAAGMSTALNIYFGTYFWELESIQLGTITLAGFPAALIAFMIAPTVAKRIGKKHAVLWISGIAIALSPSWSSWIATTRSSRS